ncbi:MAG: hypothetical protein WCY18_08170 [Methanofastidiosum sp.]|jgi:uncharacterized protein YwgA|nr:hypothetical protein [Bacteroidales bacterium]
MLDDKMEEIREKSAIVGRVIKVLKEKDPSKQIGKTFIQKIMYILDLEKDLKLDYEMYHYGPYSEEVDFLLDVVEEAKLISIEWNEKGYNILPTTNLEEYLEDKEDLELEKILNRLIDKYIKFNASQLAVISTGLYLKDNYEIEDNDLPKAVKELKPKYKIEDILSLLKQSGVCH